MATITPHAWGLIPFWQANLAASSQSPTGVAPPYDGVGAKVPFIILAWLGFYFCFRPRRSSHCDGFDECQLGVPPVACPESQSQSPASPALSFISSVDTLQWARVEFSGLWAELACLLPLDLPLLWPLFSRHGGHEGGMMGLLGPEESQESEEPEGP